MQIYENSQYLQTKRAKNRRYLSKNAKRPGKESIFSEALGLFMPGTCPLAGG
jgi:hypothetical protein